jgi:hypothetical protein
MRTKLSAIVFALGLSLLATSTAHMAPTVSNPQNGSIGVEAKISSPAPAQAPTINNPSNGSGYQALPVKVSGLCSGTLLVKIYRNSVFGGSTQCNNGSYDLSIDLFSGKNDLVARQFDELDQSSPDSNTSSVNYSQTTPQQLGPRVSLLTSYAKRGADPSVIFDWPATLTGGTGPYAISIDWGDGVVDLLSRATVGDFAPKHAYPTAGSYPVIFKATDASGVVSYIQVVAIVNGLPGTNNYNSKIPAAQPQVQQGITKNTSNLGKYGVFLLYAIIILAGSTFWLGKRHELQIIKRKMRRGDRPF